MKLLSSLPFSQANPWRLQAVKQIAKCIPARSKRGGFAEHYHDSACLFFGERSPLLFAVASVGYPGKGGD